MKTFKFDELIKQRLIVNRDRHGMPPIGLISIEVKSLMEITRILTAREIVHTIEHLDIGNENLDKILTELLKLKFDEVKDNKNPFS